MANRPPQPAARPPAAAPQPPAGKPQPPQPGAPAGQAAPVPHERVAMRAYEKWCQRGCPPGTDEQDWYEAEAEVRAEMTRSTQQPNQPAGQPRR